MLVRIGPDGTEVNGSTLHITEEMLSLPQPVNYTCIARNTVEMENHHQLQQQRQRMYRSAANTETLYEVKSSVIFTVGQ